MKLTTWRCSNPWLNIQSIYIFDNFFAKSEGRLEPDEAYPVKSPPTSIRLIFF
jgi:hypothetical protein